MKNLPLFEWPVLLCLICVLSTLIIFSIKYYNAITKINLLKILYGELPIDLLFRAVKKLPLKHFDGLVLQSLTLYYNRSISDVLTLRDMINNIRRSDTSEAKEEKMMCSLKQALINKPADTLGKIYASCLIKENCDKETFKDEEELIEGIVSKNMFYISDVQKFYLSIIKCLNDFIGESSNEKYKESLKPFKLKAEADLAQYQLE